MKLGKTIGLLLCLALLALLLLNVRNRDAQPVTPEPASTKNTRIVADSEGDEIEIPVTVTKVAPAIGAFVQMTEMLTGGGKVVAYTTSNIKDYFKKVFPDLTEANPNGYDSTSVEDIIASGAQVAYGPASVLSEEQRAQLLMAGIPFVKINNMRNVAGMCESFTIIGNILGEEEAARAKQFVDYYKGSIQAARDLTKDIPEDEKVSIINIRMAGDQYSTINGRDICHEYIEAAGGINAAKDYAGQAEGTTLILDAEQLVEWNPQVIITGSRLAAETLLKDLALANVDAIKNGKVYNCPYGIYMWSVRSGEGAMMAPWLGTKMYPDLFRHVDMNKEVKEFFKVYYNYDIPDDEAAVVLSGR